MTALPSIAEAGKLLPNDSPALSLYVTILLPAEKEAIQPTDKHVNFRVIFARVIGYLLLYPPSDRARITLQGEVAHCKDENNQNQAVYDLGKKYLMDFILPMQYRPDLEDATPQPIFLEYGDASFQRIQEEALQSKPERPRNVSKAKGFALIRDGFRCMLSRVGDAFAVHRGVIPLEPQDSPLVHVMCCHIFPAALELEEIPDDGIGAVQREHAAALWAILGRFGYKRIHDELQGTNIHRLENIMTFVGDTYVYFRKMYLWLEEDDSQPDCYCVGASTPLVLQGHKPPIPERVRFVARANLPLPDRTYLHIHATCCHIAHLSGAWRQLEAIYWEGLEAAMDDEGVDELERKWLHEPLEVGAQLGKTGSVLQCQVAKHGELRRGVERDIDEPQGGEDGEVVCGSFAPQLQRYLGDYATSLVDIVKFA